MHFDESMTLAHMENDPLYNPESYVFPSTADSKRTPDTEFGETQLYEESEPFIVTTLEQASEKIEKDLAEYIQALYEKFPYHNIEHAQEVSKNALELFDQIAKSPTGRIELFKSSLTEAATPELKAKAADDKQLELLRVYLQAISLGHDMIQVVEVNPETGMLVRMRGMAEKQSEGETAKFIHDYLDNFVYEDGKKVFEDFGLERVKWDLAATVAEFSKM